LKRATARAGSDAYQGAFEAVGAVLIATGAGYWIDKSWETSPWGIALGALLGFMAMVLRLVRLGKELHPEVETGQEEQAGQVRLDNRDDEHRPVGMSPGMSDVLREDEVPRARSQDEDEDQNGEDPNR
jgi:F0F1-type ATP synthase assembly protein I